MPVDDLLCPTTRSTIEAIARRLRTMRCDNSLVAMNLHRIARDLEAITLSHATPERCGCRSCAEAAARPKADHERLAAASL